MMEDQQQQPSNKLDCGPPAGAGGAGGGGGGGGGGGMVPGGGGMVPGLHGAEASALQLKIKNSICKSVQSKVDSILQDVEKFTDIEKLYLYLKLPSGPNPSSEKSEQSSMSSSRTQQVHAFNWICNNLEEHPETSLPKQEVYDEYKSYCDNLNYHPLSAADFGKIMKNVFPNMKARRLGMRGKSKYCYSGLRKRPFVHMPSLPSLDLHKTMDGHQCDSGEASGQLPGSMKEEVQSAACGLVCEWAQKVLSRQFDAVEDLARFLLNSHYISNKSMAALTIMTAANTGAESPQMTSAFVPTTAESHSFQPQASTLPSPSIDAKQQLQRKIHRKQQEQKLHSPSPLPTGGGGDAQAKKADEGTTPTGMIGTAAPRDSPRLLSPPPTIGIVVAAVPSPVTVQRNRQLMSPSPVNFQVLTQTVQPVRLSPKTPHNVLYSPTGDRASSRQRYAQILPKPSAASGITLRSPPAVLIANSPVKTVIPTCHVTSVNVVKMTTVTLAPNASSAATSITSSGGMRPASAGVNAPRVTEEFRPRPRLGSGSALPVLAPVARPGWATVTPPVDVEMEAIHEKSQVMSAGRREGAVAPRSGRAASVPALQMRGSLGLEEMSRPSSTTNPVVVTGSSNNSTSNESPLHSITIPAQNARPVSGINGATTPSSVKEGFLSTKCPRKRSGLSPVSHLSPVKRVFISQQPLGSCEELRHRVSASPRNPQRPVALLRPESAPAIGGFPVKLNLTAATHGLAGSPLGGGGFQTVAKTQGSAQRTNAPGVMETHRHQHHPITSSSTDPQGGLMSPVSAEREPEGGHRGHMFMQHVERGGLLGQAAASGQPAAHHTELDYFPFNDDDMTQDSIVEELVQMEEQMKLNNMQEFGPPAAMQDAAGMPSGGQAMASFYHSASAPVQTPTPTPTPTSEMMGGGAQGLTRESPYSRMASSTTPVDSALGSSRHTPVGTPHSNCSSTVPQSPVECRNPFAFTPINSSMAAYHDGNNGIVSSSPVKPMQRPTATHPDKAKLDWMNSSYGSGGGGGGIDNLPSYQDLVDDRFQKPHAFAVPSQSCHSQARHGADGHFGRLTPISPVQQQVASMAAGASRQEGFAVPAPLDNKGANSGSSPMTAAFRCRSVSPAVRQRNLSGSTGNPAACPGVPRSAVSPFNSPPVTPEVLNIFANSQSNDADVTSAAQRSRSVPVNVMMQTAVPPNMQGQQRGGQKIADVLLSKMDGDCDDSVRGLGVNNVPSSYTACMNLTQILESGPSMPCTAKHPANAYNFHKTNYLMKNATSERFLTEGQSRATAPGERQQQGLQHVLPPLQQQRQSQQLMQQQQNQQQMQQQQNQQQMQQQQSQQQMQQQLNQQQMQQQLNQQQMQQQLNQQQMQRQQNQQQGQPSPLLQRQQGQPSPLLQGQPSPLLQRQQGQPSPLLQQQQGHPSPLLQQQQGHPSPLLQQQQDQPALLQQHQNQQLHFNTTVKQLLANNSLHPGNQLAEEVSELSAGGAGFPGEVRMTSDLSGNINDLNTLDTNLLFDPGQQQGQYGDTTPEELMNDPLFQQICNETANSSGFDWLESKDHPTVGLMG